MPESLETNGPRAANAGGRVRFGPFEARLRTRELTKLGYRLRLAEKPFLVLAALLEQPGEMVTREELRRRLWAGDTFVDFDNNLNSAVATLREALGDSARHARYIETLPRLGYRFIAEVQRASCTEAEAASPRDPEPRATPWPAWALATTGVVLTGLLAGHLGPALRSGAKGGGAPAMRGEPPPAPRGYAEAMYLIRAGDAASFERSIALLDQAVTAVPGHAPSHAAWSEVMLRITLRGDVSKQQGFAQAERAARRALQLDPASPAAQRTLALVALHRDWDFAAAALSVQRALGAQPGEAETWLVAATLQSALGRFDDAVASARRAILLDPGNWRVRADLAFFLLAAGRLEEAAAESREVLGLEPRNSAALDFLLAASERLGHYENARSAAVELMQLANAGPAELHAVRQAGPREAVRRYRDWQVRYLETHAARAAWPPMTRAAIYASAGHTDRAFEWLERAYRCRDAMLVLLASSPDLASVRHHPRFARLARLIGLPAPPS